MSTIDKLYEPVTVTDDDDIGSNRSSNQPLLEIARTRMSRRTALKGFVPRLSNHRNQIAA